MGAFLHDLTLLQHDNLVGVPDRRKPVSDYNAGLLSISNKLIQCHLHMMFAFSIECAGSLVKQNHFRLADQGSGYGDPLLLSARESDTALTDHTIEALWEELLVLDEVQAVRHSAGLANALHNLILAQPAEVDSVADIVANRAREEDRFLLHESDLLLVVPSVVQVFQVAAREENLAVCGVVEALNKLDDARLAASRVANECDNLVGLDVDGDAFEDGHVVFGGVGKLDGVEVDVARGTIGATWPLVALEFDLVRGDHEDGHLVG